MDLDAPKPCRYGPCVSFSVTKSWMGYCAIHHLVVTDEVMFNKALSGQCSPSLKEFATEVKRGLYPKAF